MRALLSLLLLAVISPSASAKCATQFYVVSGTVVSDDGAPVSNALVGVSWIEQSIPSGPAMALTDQNGRYSIPIQFSSDSGVSPLFGDKCGAALNQVAVSAYTSTRHSESLLVPASNAPQITAPPIKIDRPIEREPLWPDEAGG